MYTEDNDQYLQLLTLQEADIALSLFLSYVHPLFPMEDKTPNCIGDFASISLERVGAILPLYRSLFHEVCLVRVFQVRHDFWKEFGVRLFQKIIKEMIQEMEQQLYTS